jgi:hypothetical protein
MTRFELLVVNLGGPEDLLGVVTCWLRSSSSMDSVSNQARQRLLSNLLLSNYYPTPNEKLRTKFLVPIAYSLATMALKFSNK